MNADDRKHWEGIVRALGIPPELKTFIETTAQASNLPPWEYILEVLWGDHDRAQGPGMR